MDKLIKKVEEINKAGGKALFVWLIAPNYGGIGTQISRGTIKWNVVPGFASEEELEHSIWLLEKKYG